MTQDAVGNRMVPPITTNDCDELSRKGDRSTVLKDAATFTDHSIAVSFLLVVSTGIWPYPIGATKLGGNITIIDRKTFRRNR